MTSQYSSKRLKIRNGLGLFQLNLVITRLSGEMMFLLPDIFGNVGKIVHFTDNLIPTFGLSGS